MKTGMKIAGKLFLLVLSASLMWLILTPVFRKNPSSSAYQLSLLPENSIDVLVLGSSHAQYSVNPGVIYDHSDLYTFVLGTGCQPMIMSYYYLEEALKTQSPEVVILEVFTMLPSQAVCYADGMFYVAASQMSGQTRIDAINEIDNAEKIQEYLYDLAITHDSWREEGFYRRGIDGLFGYVPMQPTDFSSRYVAMVEPSEKEVELKQKDVSALKRIVSLCEEKGIQLILMKTVFDRTQGDVSALNQVKAISAENQVPFIDFHDLVDEMEFTFGPDGDTWHNTIWGAEKVSKILANYLVENQLCHHVENPVLEPLYQNLANESVKWLLEKNVDIYKLMNHALDYKMSVIVRYLGNDQSSAIGQYENETLNKMGLNFDFIENGDLDYYAVVQNGEVVKDGQKPFDIELNGTLISIDEQEIRIGNQNIVNLGELELIFCGNDFSWIHEMPLDVHSKAFWKNGCAGWVCFGN